MKINTAIAVAITCSVLALTASAQAKPLSVDDLAQFQVGVATVEDVEAKLGKPISISASSDGTKVLAYGSVHARPKAISFVPIVGLFAAGATSESTTIVLVFGPDGLLKSTSSSSSNLNCSANLLSAGCVGR